MSRLRKLRERRAAVTEEMQAMSATLESEDRLAFNDDEKTTYAALEQESESLDGEIEREERLEARTQTLAASAGRKVGPGASAPLTTNDNERTVIGDPRPRVLDDPKRGFMHVGEFAAAVHSAGLPGQQIDKRLAASGDLMAQKSGADGGFTVPPQFSSTIWDGLNQQPDNLLARTDNYTVEGESLTFLGNAETSRATGSRFGGVQAYWLSEGTQLTESNPAFRQIKIEPQELAVLVYVTDKLLRNSSVALEQYLTRAATEEIAFMTSDAIINGTGAGQPLGIINAACTVSVTKETGQAAATIVAKNINKMWSRLHPKSRANAAWFYNIDCEPSLQDMAMDVGTGGVPVYMPPGGIADAPLGRIKGRPAIPVEYCATLGTVGDIILADLSAYVSGTRGTINSAMSMHLKFDYAKTAFRFIYEVDGQPWLASAITPFKGTNTLSPFITLATRS